MKSLPRRESASLWDKYWDEMSEEWFKIEVLQDYRGEDDCESLRNWLKGNYEQSIEQLAVDPEPDFTRDCRLKVSRGVQLLRIHIIEEPLTDYMRWEIEFYKKVSVPLRGEQVFIINKADTLDLNIPNGDLMIFDKKRAIKNSYQNGRAVRQDFYGEHDNIADFFGAETQLKSPRQAAPGQLITVAKNLY